MTIQVEKMVKAGSLETLKANACQTIHLNGHVIAMFYYDGNVYAVDNRCPHMGFPLDKGSVKDGILTCHWHHARFDLVTGGTFDLWADDIPAFPVDIRDGEIWLDLSVSGDPKARQREQLQVGLERDISLVIGKAVMVLLENGGDPVEPFRIGVDFGTRYRQMGWGQGLTMHTCFMRMLPLLEEDQRPKALFHGLSAVARDSFGSPPRFPVRPLPGEMPDIATLKRWFRQFVAVRDSEGSERCIVSAIRSGATPEQMANMLFAAVTDFRYIDVGHPADFTNKALEALDLIGWESAETVLTSLVSGYAGAMRMEESNAWRNPIDIVALLEAAFPQLDDALAAGEAARAGGTQWESEQALVDQILQDNPGETIERMLEALRAGCTMHQLAAAVSYAAALRIARFHTSNEFPDWDTALHTFTFANAIESGLTRTPSAELLRGVFDAAMSVYLDRFLNIPAAKIPSANGATTKLDDLENLYNRQKQVNQAAKGVVDYLAHGQGSDEALIAQIGRLLLREDRDFHTIQCVEAAFHQYRQRAGTEAGTHFLIAAARYLAAHAPTMRATEQTYGIIRRLHRGEHLFQSDE